MKGRLPWPAKGRKTSDFDPEGGSGDRGLGLSLAPGAEVRAVYAGKVAHAHLFAGPAGVGFLAALVHEGLESCHDVRQPLAIIGDIYHGDIVPVL